MAEYPEYLKKELIRHIREEMDKGVPLWDIRNSLLKIGHQGTAIDEAIMQLNETDFAPVKKLKTPVSLRDEMVYDVKKALIRYIEEQLNKGHDPEKIKEHCINYGHSKQIIDQAFREIMFGDEPLAKEMPSLGKVLALMFPLLLVASIVLIIFTAAGTNEPLGRILSGFLPYVLSLFIVGASMNSLTSKQRATMWLVPVILVVLFYVAGTSGAIAMMQTMQMENLAVLNLILSLAAVYLLGMATPVRKAEPKNKKEELKEVKKTVTKKESASEEPKKKEPIIGADQPRLVHLGKI